MTDVEYLLVEATHTRLARQFNAISYYTSRGKNEHGESLFAIVIEIHGGKKVEYLMKILSLSDWVDIIEEMAISAITHAPHVYFRLTDTVPRLIPPLREVLPGYYR